MESSPSYWRAWFVGKPFAIWVIFGGLLYFGLGLIVLVVPFVLGTPGDPIAISSVAFAAILLVAAFASLTGKRWAFAFCAGVTILFLLLFGPFMVPGLSNPAEPTFWLAFSGLPALILVLVFSILALQGAKVGLQAKPSLASVRSTGGLLTIAVVGLVVGGLVVGNIATTTIARALQGAQQPYDVRIVSNAALVALPFDPATFEVAVGGTVIWFNADTASHTVTSNLSSVFDSGNMGPGARFEQVFREAGTYRYRCSPHPWMVGTIVVS